MVDKFQNIFFGKLLSKLKRNDDGKVVVDSTPEFIQLPVHQGWEDSKAQIELMPSVPMLQPYMGYNPGSDIAMKYAIKSPDITKIYAPKSQKEILDIAMNQALLDIEKKESEKNAKAEADKKKAAAHNAKIKTFYSKMSDSDKRALQDMLKVAGYYKGEVDGLIGLKTLEALRQFQAAQKLTVDSMAGRNTFDALRAATRQTAQPVEDVTKVPGYQQAVEILAKMNAPATVTRTGGPTGGMGLNDVLQGRPVELAVMPVNYGQPDLSLTKMNKQGGWLNKKF